MFKTVLTTSEWGFKFWSFVFCICLEFRNSDLGFQQQYNKIPKRGKANDRTDLNSIIYLMWHRPRHAHGSDPGAACEQGRMYIYKACGH